MFANPNHPTVEYHYCPDGTRPYSHCEDRDLFRVILLHTDVLEVMATPEPLSVEGSGAASSSSSASSSNQKRIAELSDEE